MSTDLPAAPAALDPTRIRAISIDLDDTLWPSAPTLARAEQRAHDWLATHAPEVAAHWSIEQFRERAVVGIQSASGYEEGRPRDTNW